MPRRYYASTAVATTLSGSLSNSATSVSVTALSGFPASTPWTAIIDKDTASEEVVTVTNVAGTTLTVTRGVDGTTAVSHNAGAVFQHGVSARDFDEPNDHINSSTDVHTQYVGKSVLNAKGSLIAASAASTPANVAVGSNDTVLVADSTQTAGVKWATLTAAQIPTLSSAKVPTLDTNSQTGNYTLVLGDAGKTILMGSGSAQTLTIPLNSSVAFPTGTKIDIVQTGAGQADVAGTAGVTLNSDASKKKINVQYGAATIIKTATDTWVLIGNLKA